MALDNVGAAGNVLKRGNGQFPQNDYDPLSYDWFAARLEFYECDQGLAKDVSDWCEQAMAQGDSGKDDDLLLGALKGQTLDFASLFSILSEACDFLSKTGPDQKTALAQSMKALQRLKLAAGPLPKPGQNRKMLLDFADLLEREATNTVAEVAHKAARFNLIARAIARDSEGLQMISCEVAETAHRFSQDVADMAGTANRLEELCREIQQEVGQTGETSQNARILSGEASEAVLRLNSATEQISGVVALIRNIANQTRMLSLNATIEAARAGEFGAGFAVVANEVKQLAGETENSIAQVSSHAEDIAHEAQDTTKNITDIDSAIASVDDHAKGIQASVAEQLTSAGDICMRMSDASEKANTVSERIQSIFEQSNTNLEASKHLREMAKDLSGDMDGLRKKILEIVGVSEVGRSHMRVPAALPISIEGGGKGIATDISAHGALIKPDRIEDFAQGQDYRVRFGDIGSIPVRVLLQDDKSVHVTFVKLDSNQSKDLQVMIQAAIARDKHFGKVCQDQARKIEAAFQKAINDGQASLDDFLSDKLDPIPGTNPQQYKSPVVDLTDRLITQIQDQALIDHPDFVMCCSIDRNAYIGTHNSQYSKTPRADDPVWNAGNCRNRRIFDDKAGLLAAHNQEPLLTQTYERDMGGGVFVFLKEVDAPIFLYEEDDTLFETSGTHQKRHWGNVRIGYKA